MDGLRKNILQGLNGYANQDPFGVVNSSQMPRQNQPWQQTSPMQAQVFDLPFQGVPQGGGMTKYSLDLPPEAVQKTNLAPSQSRSVPSGISPTSQPMIIPSDPLLTPVEATPGSGGSSLWDSLKSGLRGFGNLLAEGGFAATHRMGGNQGDYLPAWNQQTVLENPNSELSRRYQQFASQNLPGDFSNATAAEIQGVLPAYEKARYNDYLTQQAGDKAAYRDAQLALQAQRLSGKSGPTGGGGGSRGSGGKLSASIENDLAKKRGAFASIDNLITNFDPNSQPNYPESATMGVREKIASTTGLPLENEKSKMFQQTHNRAVEDYLLAMTGQAASDPSYKRLLAQVPNVYSPNYQKEMQAWRDDIARRYGATTGGARNIQSDSGVPQGGGMIRMRFPDGKIKSVPASEEAKWSQYGVKI